MAETKLVDETGKVLRILREGEIESIQYLQQMDDLVNRIKQAFSEGKNEVISTAEEIQKVNELLSSIEDTSRSLASRIQDSIGAFSSLLSILKGHDASYRNLANSLTKVQGIGSRLAATMQTGVNFDRTAYEKANVALEAEKSQIQSIEATIQKLASSKLPTIDFGGGFEQKQAAYAKYIQYLQTEQKLSRDSERVEQLEKEIKLVKTLQDRWNGIGGEIQDVQSQAKELYDHHQNINKTLQGRLGLGKTGRPKVVGHIAGLVGLKDVSRQLLEASNRAEEAGRQAGMSEYTSTKDVEDKSWEKLPDGRRRKQLDGGGFITRSEAEAQANIEEKALKAQKVAAEEAAGSALKAASLFKTTILGIGAAIGAAILKSLLKVSTEAANVKREIGQWGIGVATGNAAFASTRDTLVVIQDIVKNIGMNPVTIFTDKELGKMAEAKNILGLTTEQAVGLGIKSKLAGVGADAYRDAIARGNNEVNKYGIAHGQVLDGVLEASDAITLSLGNQPGKIASAVIMAKSLGLELREIENIQQNLLSFESSIENEMQAQLLTGRNINLNKAREYALMNDLEGVAREIKQQGVDMATFGRMNVIQQESLAKALGMNREQLAKSIILQEMQNGLSAEAIAQSMNMNKESIEAMGIQERWTKSVEQLKEAFTPILSILIPIAQIVSSIVSRIGWLIGSLPKLVGIKGYDSPTNRMSDWASGTSGPGYKETSSAKKTNKNAGVESEIAELEKLKRREGDKAKHDELQARINELRSKSTVLQQEVDKIVTSGAKIERPVEAGTNILGVLLTLSLGFPMVVNGIAGAARMVKAFAGSVVNYYRLAGTRVAALGKTVRSTVKGGNLTGGVKSVGNKVKSKQGKNLGQQQGFSGKKLNKVANDISSSEKKLSGVKTTTFDTVANTVSRFFKTLSRVKTAGSSKVATTISNFFRKLSRIRTAKVNMLPGAATSVMTTAGIIGKIKAPVGGNSAATSIRRFFDTIGTITLKGLLMPVGILVSSTVMLLASIVLAAMGKVMAVASPLLTTATGAITAFFQGLSAANSAAVAALPTIGVVTLIAVGLGGAAALLGLGVKLLGEGLSKVINSITSFIPALVAGLAQLSNIEFTKLLGVGASLLLFGGGLTVALLSLVGAFVLGRPALLGVSMLSMVLAKLGEVDTSKFSTIKTDLIDLGEGVRALSVVEDVKVGRLNRLSKVLARFKGLAGIGAELRSFATGMQALSSMPLEVPEPEKLNLDQVVTASQQVRGKNTIQSEDRRKVEAEKANQVIRVEKEESKNTEIDQRILAVLSRIEGTLKNPIKLDWDDREFRMYQASIEYSN